MKKFLPIIIIIICLFLSSCAKEAVTAEAALMDTICRVTIYGSQAQAEGALSLVSGAEQEFSKTIPQSDVYKLNHAMGSAMEVDSNTYDLLSRTLDIANQTGGAYNPAMGAVIDLWGIGTDHEAVPGEKSLSSALAMTDYASIRLSENNTVSIADTQLDLGGAVKGYALDLIKDYLDEQGVESGVAALGGSVYAKGVKPDGAKYRVGVRDPQGGAADYIAVIELEDKCVSTSGNYERGFYQGDTYYHHIFDPDTGMPADNELVSVSVVSEDGLLTDIYSTALYVMGLEDGLEYADLNGIEAAFVTQDKKIYLTQNFAEEFELTDESYIIASQ